MTEKKDDTERRKKRNLRQSSKHPNLQKKFTLSTRQDYLDIDYVNGVYDRNGNELIRPLNTEEKDFLDKFYEEWLSADFFKDPELKDLNNQLRVLKRNKNQSKEEKKEYNKLKRKLDKRAKELLLYWDEDGRSGVYAENNARNRCIYNKQKAAGRLHQIDEETFNGIHDNVYFCADAGENLLINQVENKVKVKLKKRKKETDE